MLNTIIQHCFLLSVTGRLNKPFSFDYRIKSLAGGWAWMHETKCVIAVTKEGKNELIVGRVVDITDIKRESYSLIKKLMEEDGNTNSLLLAAMQFLYTEQKRPMSYSGITILAKREKEILQPISEGYSTKQMASNLHISINR